MAKTEIGVILPGWGKDVIDGAELVAEINENELYEVDQTRIYADKDGTFVLATASGCSCWDGKWYASRYDTVEELLTDIGPSGEADNGGYNPSFKGVEDLTAQVKAWQSK